MKTFLFKNIDNAPLIAFRIFFGFLIACESYGALFTGWVTKNLIETEYTFPFIGFDWLKPLPGDGMYFYFILMGTMGVFVMLGYYYRIATILYCILWSGVYFMQKTSYNNHYYLLMIISFFMIFLPANAFASIDVKQGRTERKLQMPNWISLLFIVQIAILYFYASIAKLYLGWLDGTFTKNLLIGATASPFFINLFSKPWFYLFIAYAGIFFDLLIVPFLLFRKTRTIALIASLIFHLFNATVLHIGIFPFFALSFSLFFYDPKTIRNIFFKRKSNTNNNIPTTNYFGNKVIYYLFIPFLIIQLILPIRHHFIKGDVLWTEEGHRLSWRMMLRERTGFITIKIRDNQTNAITNYNYHKNLTNKQVRNLATKPDFIWQYCQRIKKEYSKKNISIFIDCENSINGGSFKKLIDPKQDFAKAEWNYFFHNDWIVLQNL